MTTQVAQKAIAKKAVAKKNVRKVLIADNKAAQVATLVSEFNAAKLAEKEAKAKKDAVELQIREMLGSNEAISVDGVERIRLGFGTNSSIDRALLSEAFPEAFEQTLRSTPYSFIKAV